MKKKPAMEHKAKVVRKSTVPPERRYEKRAKTLIQQREAISEQEDLAFELLGRGLRVWTVIGVLKDRFSISTDTARVRIRHAREEMRRCVGKSTDEMICDGCNAMYAVLADPAARHSDRINAQKTINDMFQLELPKRVAITTPDGTQSALDLSTLPPAILQQIVVHMQSQELKRLES